MKTLLYLLATFPILNILLVLVIVGVGLYLINKYVPMAEPVKTILNVVVVLLLVIWLLKMFNIV